MKRGFASILILALVVAVFVLAGAFYLRQNKKHQTLNQLPIQEINQKITPSPATKSIIVKNIAVILFKFSDTTEEPYTTDEIKNKMFLASDSVKNYYEENSYKKWQINGDVFGWYKLSTVGDGSCNTSEWSKEAEVIAKSNGVLPQNYTNIVFLFVEKGSGCTYGGWHIIGDNRSFVMSPSQNILIHELGHSFGLAHSNTLSCKGVAIDSYAKCTNQEYGDTADVMGGFGGLGDALPHFNGPHKDALGWVPATNIINVSQDGTYTISPLDSVSSEKQIIKINKPDTNERYYLEYRQPLGIFSKDLPPGLTKGVSIRIWNGDPKSQPLLLDTTPGSCFVDPINPNPICNNGDFSDAALSDGANFVDPVNKISIAQIKHDGGSATVQIKFNQ